MEDSKKYWYPLSSKANLPKMEDPSKFQLQVGDRKFFEEYMNKAGIKSVEGTLGHSLKGLEIIDNPYLPKNYVAIMAEDISSLKIFRLV